jgi:hypothetical protein
MELITTGEQHATIRVGSDELTLINNTLNEVANGMGIADTEFYARLGASRLDVQQLLAEVGNVFRA